MDFKTEQSKFDVIKWYDSIVAGVDRCGSYEFCAYCDKEEPEPCARAAYRSRPCATNKIAVIRIRFKKAKGE